MLSGKEFNRSTALWMKNLPLMLVLNLGLNSFCGPPLVVVRECEEFDTLPNPGCIFPKSGEYMHSPSH